MISTRTFACGTLVICLLTLRVHADEAMRKQVVQKAIEFMKSKGQASDGSFYKASGTGVTSLATAALLRNGVPATDPAVAKAIQYIESHIRPDGGIYREGSRHRNYETSISVMALTEANQDGRYDKVLKKADAFLKNIQWDEGEGKTSADFDYGGAGYGSHSRPDLSNTTMLLEALKALGNDDSDPAIQRALTFVSRCQNLESPHNTTPFAAKNPDGGFYYTPAAGGTSQAGETAAGGLRSYGSMTYAGLKSMIYAGVDKDDQRVKAATEWIRKHYNLDANPGMGNTGLYYYYHTFAKTMDALNQDVLVDADGNKHNWKDELVAELASRQAKDGSWQNSAERWLEGEATLATAYSLLALSYCK